ncbi:MAG: ADOP family duplicated permease [Gemmatimonadota bacterium]
MLPILHLAKRRLRALLRRREIDAELAEEMQHHVDLETRDLMLLRNLPMEEARRRALATLGGMSRFHEEHREARGVSWIEEVARDLRHGARGLARSPAYTVTAALVLAIGIGSTTAVHSAVNAVMREPAHENLAAILFRGFPSLSTVDLRAIEELQQSFESVGAVRLGEVPYRTGTTSENLRIGRVTAGFHRAIGSRLIAGRQIEPADEAVGSPRVAIIGKSLADRLHGGAAGALGTQVTIDGVPHTVVGILAHSEELFATRAEAWPALQLAQPERRGPFGLMTVARLKPGVTFESASRDVAGISERIFPLWTPGFNDRTARYEAAPIRSSFLAQSGQTLRTFSLAVGLVLLVGIANVASLTIVRLTRRLPELSLRANLGAGRARLARLVATEGALLAFIAAAVGVGLGLLFLKALIILVPGIPGLDSASLDPGTVAFAVGLSIAAASVVVLTPMLLLPGSASPDGPAGGSRTTAGGRALRLARSGFVVAQFALALPVLAVAALLLASFASLQRVDPGFDASNLLTVRVSLPLGQYAGDSAISAYWVRALPLLRTLPGVREAGLATSMPPDDFGSSNDNFNLIDRPVTPGEPEPNGPWPSIDNGYLNALGVRLVEGRGFTPVDTGATPVILVSRTWAGKYYPGESPVGKTLIRGGCTECPPTTIAGVVEDVPFSGIAGPRESMYSPMTEQWSRNSFLFVRTEGSPRLMAEPVLGVLRSMDASIPMREVVTMEERLTESIAQPRHWAILLGTFAAMALGLAAIGIFGMLSFVVATRRREIGVRMALGADRRTITLEVVRHGLSYALVGAAIGFALAIVGARSMESMLFDVAPGDPLTLFAVTVMLLVVALLACWLPARRAAGVDPIESIRQQ